MLGHGIPLSHRPHGPAIGAASASPGRSSATTTKARYLEILLILIFEQYCKYLYSVNRHAGAGRPDLPGWLR